MVAMQPRHDFMLYANATDNTSRDFGDLGDSNTFHRVFANTKYSLSELGPEGYDQFGNWTCDKDVSVINSAIELIKGQTVTCKITNDDIPAGLTLMMNLTQPDYVTDVFASDFTLSANETTTMKGFSGTWTRTD